MADSGLDIGSITSAQETTSENSSIDIDESNDSRPFETCKKASNFNVEPCTAEDNLPKEKSPNFEATGCSDEISEYKNHMLKNSFFESNTPLASLHLSKNNSLELGINQKDVKSPDELFNQEKMLQNSLKSHLLVKRQEEDLNNSANNSYYFIDASSLNDDLDVTAAETPTSRTTSITTSVTALTSVATTVTRRLATTTASTIGEHAYNLNDRLTKSNSDLPNESCNTLSRTNEILVNDDDPPFKMINPTDIDYQNQNERMAEFKHEQLLSGFLEDSVQQSANAKSCNLLPIHQEDNSCKNMNKESLVVEIKEADSGESALHSPCPDNTKVDELQQKVEEKLSLEDSSSPDQQLNSCPHDETSEKRPLLIRRNTFELDSNDERLSSLRQEYERRQGSLVFQNSITQYSSHRIDGESYFDIATSQSDSMIAASSLPLEVNYYPTHLSTINNSNRTFNRFDSEAINSILMLSNVVGSLDRATKHPANAYQKGSESNGKLDNAISRSASDRLLPSNNSMENEEDISFNSLPVNINDQDPKSIDNTNFQTVVSNSKLRRIEAAPIVSGGSSSDDYKKVTDSPSVKRRTESTPIVSGGSCIVPEDLKLEDKVKDKAKINAAAMAHSMHAWVVDMSDCRNGNGSNGTNQEKSSAWPKKAKDPQTTVSLSSSLSSRVWCSDRSSRDKSQPSSLGYFVNLDDLSGSKERSKEEGAIYKHRRRPSDVVSEKSYCEFFVDLADKQNQQQSASKMTSALNKAQYKVTANQSASTSESSMNDARKNIFSMFIDLNEPAPSSNRTGSFGNGKSVTSKIAEKSRNKMRDELINGQYIAKKELDLKQSESHVNEDKKHKPSVFMFIESDSPVVRRRTLSSSRPAFKRHSWNTDKSNESSVNGSYSSQQHSGSQGLPKVHKRAHSLSVDRLGNESCLSPLLDAASKLEQERQQQQQQYQQQLQKREQEEQEKEQQLLQKQQIELESEYDARDTPPNSHVEILNHEELLLSLKSRNYQELDAINEQKGNEAKNKVVQSNNQHDACCSESTETRKSETFDISSSPSSASEHIICDSKITDQKLTITEKITKSQQDSRLHVRNGNKTAMNKGVNPKAISSANFVRLSDLDKRPHLNGLSFNLTNSIDSENLHRLSNNSTGTSSWSESKSITSAKTNEPLYRMLTKKLSGNLSAGSAKPEHCDEFGAEAEAEAVVSESDLSSLQSSMGRSGQGSTEETETSTSFAIGSKPYNRLGEDLLRMFLEEINPDVTIDVGGRRIRAHKCILSSRCQYFAAILSGSWVENSGNIISLQGYSYNAVNFALRHIYSGESCIPDTISIVELATLADMLCLEGLKEVIGFTLKVKYCHLFHRPCNGCAVGVLECMPLAAAYGLDEVYRKSLRWVTRHFVRIWPTKEFATLPRELMDKCYLQHIVHMSVDNVLQTIMDCDKLLTTLPNVRWAEPVFRLVSNLVDTAMKYLTDNFSGVLGSESFQALDREQMWNISRLEDHLLAAAERLPPEQACRAYSKLDKIFIFMQADDDSEKIKWSPLFMDLMNKIKGQVEKCLVRDAARASRTNSWLKMDLGLRRRIQELACLVLLPNEATNKRPSRHSNFLKEPKERQEPRMSSSRTPPNRNFDLRKVKMAISEHNDTTLKQTPLLQTRKLMNKPKTDPLQRKVNNDRLSNDVSSVMRPKSWPNKIEVKSRYLEPRNRPSVKETISQTNPEKALSQQKRKIMISSSDSSRTSSPAMRRAADKKITPKVTKVPMKKDGKALSSDSLAGSNNRSNTRKEIASKSCGITRPESPSLKLKDVEAGMSVDSLSDAKRRQQQHLLKKPTNKMDTSISTDSLMTDVTAIATPKSMSTNKSSPVLGKTTNTSVNQTRNYDKLKKLSPPSQQRSYNNHNNHINGNSSGNSVSNGNSNNNNNNYSSNGLSMRRPTRSLESSTAASRSRAAAVANTYQGSLNLRKSLLDAAKAPDIPNKNIGSPAMTRSSLRQSIFSTRSSGYTANASLNKIADKKDDSTSFNNQRSVSSPGSKRSPKSNISGRLNKSFVTTGKQKANKPEDKAATNKFKNNSQVTSGTDPNGPKFLNQSSRSGTFLKDEPTILNKSDIDTAAIDI